MLFSLMPKTKKEDLFDREELQELSRFMDIYPMIVVTGLRRVEKSSLIRGFFE
ncbi:MAG: uncharacterized protein PWP37_1108 [Thermotogota bacterium]|nr:uncharacterized protein [Thermotogota bacterium]MDK2864916.1 uncharacterized protein [Thermotogota bacterium]